MNSTGGSGTEQNAASEGSTSAAKDDAKDVTTDAATTGAKARLDRLIDGVDQRQRRTPQLAVLFGVTKKYGEDESGQLAILIAYKGFFSIFPLMLALVSILGILLHNNESLRSKIVNSVVVNIPVVGSDIAQGSQALNGSWVVLLGSAAVSIWAGLGLLGVIGQALNTIWDVAVFDRPSWALRQLRCLGGAVIVAVCASVSGAGRWVVSTELPFVLRLFAGALLPMLAGAAAYLGLHRTLCVRKVSFRAQLPGMAATSLAWWGLISLGGVYVERVINNSSNTYGVFAVVLGLLSWSYLLGMMYLYSVTLAAVLADHRWPRSLSGRNLTDQDVAAVEALAQRTMRVRGSEVDVSVPTSPDAE